MGQNFARYATKPRNERTPIAIVAKVAVLSQGFGPMLGGLRPDGSRTTLSPDTILHSLAAKNFEMLHM